MGESESQKNDRGEIVSLRSDTQRDNDKRFHSVAMEVMARSGDNWSMHGLSVMKRNAIARVLYLHHLYQQILPVTGVICEFGVHWGGSLAALVNLRGMLEPFNTSRFIYGFDTFSGFPEVSVQDGSDVSVGDFSTVSEYEKVLDQILTYHESISPFSDRKKFELIKGDAIVTTEQWLRDNPHAIVSMAIFDMDLYQPTKEVLTKIMPRLTKGSVLVFDELNCKFFPGETTAVQEVIGLNKLRLQRHPLQPYCSWAVFE